MDRAGLLQSAFGQHLNHRAALDLDFHAIGIFHRHLAILAWRDRSHFDRAGAIHAEYERKLRRYVPLFFHQGPVGIGWLWKMVIEGLVARFIPIPSFQAVHKSFWLAKQVSLSAMVFMLAAEAAGLATCPMEGFGERSVRRVLGIPSSQTVVLVIAVGYADSTAPIKTRLPLDGRVHRNGW